MTILRKPLELIGEHRRAYLILNIVGYGLMVLGITVGLIFPDLNAANVAELDADGTTEQVTELIQTPWFFAVMILWVNLTQVALPLITLPSLIVPFLGIPLFAYKAFDMAVTMAPAGSDVTASYLIPHSLTMLIEYQAYILLAFGSYLLARAWISPQSVGAKSRALSYGRGLQRFGWMWIPALILFVIGAVYEAYSLAYIVPWLTSMVG